MPDDDRPPFPALWRLNDAEPVPMPPGLAYGPNVYAGWARQDEHGTLIAELPGHADGPLTVRWRTYGLDAQRAKLANFLMGDRAMRVVETVTDTTVMNSGTKTWHAAADTGDLAVVTPLVDALTFNPNARFEAVGPTTWRLSLRGSDSGAVYNTVVYSSRSLTVTVDADRGVVTVSHSQYEDLST